jgi:hypothetical protein
MKRMYVFHNPNFLDRVVLGGFGLQLVAAVLGDTIEDAFVKTNSIEWGWWENDYVVPMFEGEACRSTSVYDIVIDEDVAYVCMPSGWERHDHLTKWWLKLKKEKVTKAVDEVFLAQTIFGTKKAQEVFCNEDAEETYIPEPEEDGPWVFTFDERDNVSDKDIPF